MSKRPYLIIALLILLAALLANCAAPPAAPADTATADTPMAPDTGSESEETAMEFKMAALFPGVITDADYNTLGYIGTTETGKNLGIETAYSESVPVPDVERAMREYIDDGYNIIFTHGGQFVNQTLTMAQEFPDVYFIAEGDAPIDNPPPNVWVIDRNFHTGFYGVGALAALISESGKIGYLGGLTLPFSNAEVHAMQQAIDDLGLDVELKPVWVGDFNDPTKARELADAMIAEDIDVIAGSLNLGMLGVFEAAKSSTQPVWITAKYTDKSSFAPDQYVSSLLYDFAGPLQAIVGNIMAGESGGYYPLGFDTGVSLQEPQHVSDEVKAQVDEITAKLISGEIEVIKNTDPIE
ncbi:MAG: BMP family protein [Anaerolineae bacterium]|nr:BMP family protein [Anaerolineae bacterium]